MEAENRHIREGKVIYLSRTQFPEGTTYEQGNLFGSIQSPDIPGWVVAGSSVVVSETFGLSGWVGLAGGAGRAVVLAGRGSLEETGAGGLGVVLGGG